MRNIDKATAEKNFIYDKNTGELFWKLTQRSGKKAGCITTKGYIRIELGGLGYYAHRVCMALAGVDCGDLQVDHINGDKSDNRLSNLRLVSNAENQQAILTPTKKNKLGVRGVTKVKDKFKACIWVDGKQKEIGKFEDIHMAKTAYLNAKKTYHSGVIL